MKKLIYMAGSILAIASAIPAVHATKSHWDLKVTHIIHSGAHPNNARFPNPTHHFEIHVQGAALSSLSIALPDGIKIRNGIEVTNQSDNRIDAQVSINNKKATVVFSQPVPAETILSINMNGVRTPMYNGFTWLYPVYGTIPGMNQEIPLGTVRIQTY
ncbi:DUF2808 domain-containing protein [Microseira wollei]|uniref:DUF2808 domain-containing protein n=1 Tax=Microseira wollei NIES-4236 TaxID=2530354 RepID=A0AAV3XAK6_9CYAN|nr:DUF2808 domain-containing protein [Microseira wollei]GET39274.1 hypothetical protein MiSe_40380 [Microseira wollei NIES-4236]